MSNNEVQKVSMQRILRHCFVVAVKSVNPYSVVIDEDVAHWSPDKNIFIIGIDGWMGVSNGTCPSEQSFEISFRNKSSFTAGTSLNQYVDGRIYKWDLHKHAEGMINLQRLMMFPRGTGIFVRSTETLYVHRIMYQGGAVAKDMGDIEVIIYHVLAEESET